MDTIVRTSGDQQAELLVLDAFRGMRELVGDELELRRFIFELGGQLGLLGVTALFTGEYARQDVERYVEPMLSPQARATTLQLVPRS